MHYYWLENQTQSAAFPNAQPLPIATALFRSKHIMTLVF